MMPRIAISVDEAHHVSESAMGTAYCVGGATFNVALHLPAFTKTTNECPHVPEEFALSVVKMPALLCLAQYTL